MSKNDFIFLMIKLRLKGLKAFKIKIRKSEEHLKSKLIINSTLLILIYNYILK